MDEQRQRKHVRFAVQTPARLWFRGDQGSVGGLLVNLGVGGAYVRCANPVEVGRDVVCAFVIADAQSVACKGRVAWIAPAAVRAALGPGFGICFAKPQQQLAPMLAATAANPP